MRPKTLVLLPAWRGWRADEEAWVSALLSLLSRTLGAVTIYDPGFPGEQRGGLRFPLRGWRDFREQCKEAIFENPIEVIIAISEAAKPENLDILAGWAPGIPRVSVFLESDLFGQRPPRLKPVSDCSDIILHRGDWKSGRGRDACVEFVREPMDVVESISKRFCLRWTHADIEPEKKQPTVDVVTAKNAVVRPRVRELIREARPIAHVRHMEIGGHIETNKGRAAFWNEGLRQSCADYVLFWDEPLWLPEKALARMLEYFSMGASLAVVSAPCRDADDMKEVRRLAALHQASGGHRECGRFLHGDFWMLRRKAMRQVGFFDERFLCHRFALYDYGFRLRQSGFRLFTATDVTAWRIAGKTDETPGTRGPEVRDLGLLQEKWCENGIGAILRLSRPVGRKDRAAAARVADGGSNLDIAELLGSRGLPSGNDARARLVNFSADYGRVSPEMKILMDESLRETERRNDGFRRAMEERSERLSQEFRKTL